MTFTLLRAGLPNSIVAAALAAVPVVAIALTTPHAPVPGVHMVVVSDGQPGANGDRVTSD
jgi:hypothetical protein